MKITIDYSKCFFIYGFKQIKSEVLTLAMQIFPEHDFLDTISLLHDIKAVHSGSFQGYRESTARYHDFSHTLTVFLATARILHGMYLHGINFSLSAFNSALYAALFHDIGYIQDESDFEGTGAKYTQNHVRRGIDFMRILLRNKAYPSKFIDDCAKIILFTDLTQELQHFERIDSEIYMMGQVLGTADLVAQLGDKYYLQKLPELYSEFVEGGISTFVSEDDLIRNTPDFFKYAKQRISTDLGSFNKYVRFHFRDRWGVDKDLYSHFMRLNLSELERVLASTGSNYLKLLEDFAC